MFTIISDSTLVIGGNLVSLPCSIAGSYRNDPQVIEKSDLVIVNIYPQNDSDVIKFKTLERDRNIWAFDQKGNIVWKVSAPPERFTRAYPSSPYTSVFEKDGKVYGGNWCGYDFEINLADGSVIPPKNPGRPW